MRILVLAPHTDDCECGCGASVAKFVDEGHDVYCVAFSSAKKSLPKNFPEDATVKEFRNATAILGIKPANLIMFNYEVRKFPEYRQDILEDLVMLNRELSPELIFMPSPHDTHQDHHTVASEGFRAFKRSSILGYEIPWNNLTFNTNTFIFLEEEHIERKIAALKCYESQKIRLYGGANFFIRLSEVRGVQIGAEYAECFETIRWIIK